jgi:glutamate racemase
MATCGSIGIFDSGYGGLTVFRSIADVLPQYDYIYLGDNARAPYGNRSFASVHQFTLECVEWFFKMGCPLVILACNTASAKALRTIQQKDLPRIGGFKRVLGVIRPTAEVVGNYTQSNSVGVLGTKGTINSRSYEIEIHHFYPEINVHQLACPMWVPIIENGEYNGPGADYFVQKYLGQLLSNAPDIDTILLACTHYPLLTDKIQKFLPGGIKLVSQGPIVAASLANYLNRHPDMELGLSRNGVKKFFTTDDTADFDVHGSLFFGDKVTSQNVHIGAAG